MKFQFVVFALWSSTLFHFNGHVAGVVSRKTYPRQCETPFLRNGLVKQPRQRGKIVQFQCSQTYVLIGSAYAGCKGGKWDSPIPVCAKTGCPPLPNPENGFSLRHIKGMATTLYCKPYYKPAGVVTTYCNGTSWDRPLGSCRATNQSNARECDFEVEDLCGWTHDETHDFEWKRVVGTDNMKRLRTGPLHDHTTMQSNAGHYMLVETIKQLPDDRARLISPVYPANASANSCFRFFYHMYGSSVGELRVYVKPMSVDIDTLTQDRRYVAFAVAGNQKNVWRKEVFRIKKLSEEFQIVLEGTSGINHLSDIAVDDVALLTGRECPYDEDELPQEMLEEDGPIVFDVQSCKDRCDETYSATTAATTIFSFDEHIIKTCDCHSECEDLQTCCPDFRSLCVFGIAGTTGPWTEEDYESTVAGTVASNEFTSSEPEPKQRDIKTTSPHYTSKFREITREITKAFETKPRVEKNLTPSTNSKPPTSTPSVNVHSSTKSSSSTSRPDVDNDVVTNQELLRNNHEWLLQKNPKITSIPSWVIFVLATAFVAVAIVGLIVAIRYYRRHYGPENYKKNAENATRNVNEEFSEVRYLTSDEHLDFTIQTPEPVKSKD